MAEPGAGMAADIAEQPEVVRHAIDAAARVACDLRRPRAITLLGRGTSEHAAQYGAYLFETLSHVPAAVGAPSVATLYDAPLELTGWLAIGVSQSGETSEIAASLRWARERGATTLALTNGSGSPLSRSADVSLLLGAGHERAIAATKTFTAECAALAGLAATWAGVSHAWPSLSDALAQVVARPAAEADADALAGAELAMVLGRGLHVPMAREFALKIMEGCGIWATGGSWADLMHGPISALPADIVALAFPGDRAGAASWEAAATRLASTRADVRELRPPEADAVPDFLRPIVEIVHAQQLVLRAARLRGVDPDRPPGLTKVTQT